MQQYYRSFLGRVSVLHLVLLGILSIGTTTKGRAFWLGGMAAAFLWLLVNSLLLHLLSKLAFQSTSTDLNKRRGIYAVCFVKFPVLYLAGLCLLLLPMISNEGILLSMTAYLAVGVGVWISRRLK